MTEPPMTALGTATPPSPLEAAPFAGRDRAGRDRTSRRRPHAALTLVVAITMMVTQAAKGSLV